MSTSSWSLDESKFLRIHWVRKLREAAKETKEWALRWHRSTPVRDWFLVEFCLCTGLRVQEVADLVCGDLQLRVRPFYVQVRHGKGDKPRLVKISASLKAVCQEYLLWKRASGEETSAAAPLFRSCQTGKHMGTRALQKSFKRSLNRAGVPRTHGIHCLRHTYGTYLYAASHHNLRMVQKQLGHSSIKTTQVYTGLLENDTEQALDRLYG